MNSIRDVLNATALVRAGRLGEATAQLRAALTSRHNPSAKVPSSKAPSPETPEPAGHTLDMERPDVGGSWTLPGSRPTASHPAGAPPSRTGWVRPPAPRPFAPSEAPALPHGARFESHRYTSGRGQLGYKLYVPSGRTGQTLPLVVMLHGCTQSPDDFAIGTHMNALAEELGLFIAYPAQTKAANASKCWNWFRPGDQTRENGEPALIAGATRQIMAAHAVDPARVFIAGLSAGGAAAAVLAEAYPELFAAVGIHSGLPCGAAHDIASAFTAMKQGSPRDSAGTGRDAGPAVRTIVFHGDLDTTVSPVNAERIAERICAIAGPLTTRTTEDQIPGGLAYSREVHEDAAGTPMLEQWKVRGLGHAWSGGKPGGSYTDPRGPDASRAMLRFFLRRD